MKPNSGQKRIAVIPGDGIGKEVMPEGLRVLETVSAKHGINLEFTEYPFSSVDYYEAHGQMLPDDWKETLIGHDALFFGAVGMGAQRWIDLGFIRLQPSEFMKVSLIMMLATYYDWLEDRKVSRLGWVLVPVMLIMAPATLVLMEPNLGTTLMLVVAGASVMFAAGVSLWYFGAVIGLIGAGVAGVFLLRGTPWQFLHDYQYRRIDTFLDPSADPLGAGYNILQAKIALGSGGMAGKGFMQGTQSRLNFLPEKHTDFIFTTLGEEFGFVGAISLLTVYAAILIFLFWAAMQNKDRFSSLLLIGIAANFFLYLAVNLAMVMGMAPVVGVPLPFLSYGGSATLVLLLAFGLAQSAIVHRLR